MATLLARHIAHELSMASALEAKIKDIVADIKKTAEVGSYTTTVNVSKGLMKPILHHFSLRGFVAIEDVGKIVLKWDYPTAVPDKDNAARHFRDVTREALAKNFDESVELVNEQIEKAAQYGHFGCDVYSLSIFKANIQALIEALNREGYTASHSGSYLHVSWED
jgi:hypothetical protein